MENKLMFAKQIGVGVEGLGEKSKIIKKYKLVVNK